MINLVKVAASVLLLIALSACGGGGGGGGGSSSIELNASGFPGVVGRYSFNTSTFDVSCSDGSAGTNPGLGLNFDISQNANVITLINTNTSGGVPGITIIDSTAATGNIQENASFIVSQIVTATIDGIVGTVTLNYNISGRFTSNGWSGTYIYTASAASFGSCTFESTFTGTKITTPTAASLTNSKSLYYIESYPLDIYDSFSIIGSYMATEE